MELTINVNPVERTVRLREVHALAAGDSCSVVLDGVRGADVSSLYLALYRDAASDSPVASCPSFSPVRGHPNLATGDLRLDTTEMAAWFEAARPEPEGSATDRDGSRSGDTAERAVRTDGWLVVSEPTRTWAACRVPVILRPGAGVSGVVDPTSIQSLVEGLVSAAMSEALDTKADLVDGKVPIEQLPSFLGSVLEYDAVSAFPTVGESGKIYVAKDTNKTYRWDVTQYVEISPSLALGETATTAYPGDKGKAAAEKADEAYTVAGQAVHDIAVHEENTNNPHAVTAAQVGAVALNAKSTVGPLFSVQYTDTTGSGDVLSFGVGAGPGGETFVCDKLYCPGYNRFFADGVMIVNEESVAGASILARIKEYGGDFKTARAEVDNLIAASAATKADKATTLAGYGITDAATKTELNAKADKSALAAKADKSTTLAGYGITDGATMASLATEYSPSSAYAVGSFVYHDGNIYQCTTAIADGGEAWNAARWELRKLDDFFTESNSLLTATVDARIPYPINAVPSTGVLKDRALNTTSLASVTVPSNFTDLLIRASVASSLSVTMPESITTKYGDTFPGEAGEYLITITKTGASEAYVRTIKLEVANA